MHEANGRQKPCGAGSGCLHGACPCWVSYDWAMHPIFVQASAPPRPQYVVRLLGAGAAIFATALIIWGHWLAGATIILAIGFVMWDDRNIARQAERDARDLQNRPFPDFEKWGKWDSDV